MNSDLVGRKDMWDELPGLHLSFQEKVVTAVFDGNTIDVHITQIDPTRISDTVYAVCHSRLLAKFTDPKDYRYGGRSGSIRDCERMSRKIAEKCERLNLFKTWLVLSF